MIAAFAWCVSQFENSPDRFREHQYLFLWDFKLIISMCS